MSQETPDNLANPQNDDGQGAAPQNADSAYQLPPAVAQELAALREEKRLADERAHAANLALLSSLQPSQAPQVDPVEAAYKQIEKETTPEAFSYIGPVIKPILKEMFAMKRDLEEARSIGSTAMARLDERDVHARLATLIPDLPKISNQLLALVKDLPEEDQRRYADNPILFVPLARALKSGASPARAAAVAEAGAAAARAGVDLGDTGARALPLTADKLAGINENSKEFAAIRANFYGTPS